MSPTGSTPLIAQRDATKSLIAITGTMVKNGHARSKCLSAVAAEPRARLSLSRYARFCLHVSLRSSQPTRPFAIMLGSMRSFDGPRAPAGRPIELSLDLTGVPSFPTYIVKVVNELGWLQVESIGVEEQGKVTTSLSGSLRRGDYIIQLYSPSREVLREYILRLSDRLCCEPGN
jgi:hypothetical protein